MDKRGIFDKGHLLKYQSTHWTLWYYLERGIRQGCKTRVPVIAASI